MELKDIDVGDIVTENGRFPEEKSVVRAVVSDGRVQLTSIGMNHLGYKYTTLYSNVVEKHGKLKVYSEPIEKLHLSEAYYLSTGYVLEGRCGETLEKVKNKNHFQICFQGCMQYTFNGAIDDHFITINLFEEAFRFIEAWNSTFKNSYYKIISIEKSTPCALGKYGSLIFRDAKDGDKPVIYTVTLELKSEHTTEYKLSTVAFLKIMAVLLRAFSYGERNYSHFNSEEDIFDTLVKIFNARRGNSHYFRSNFTFIKRHLFFLDEIVELGYISKDSIQSQTVIMNYFLNEYLKENKNE